jgi:malate synthase
MANVSVTENISFTPHPSADEGHWRAAPAPDALRDRRVEITGPVERKMMINALNSGAKVFMADLEDSNSPTWENVIDGQRNRAAAIHDLMQDAATAEISRAQVWQWIHHRIPLTPGGVVVTPELVRQRADKTADELTAAGYDPELLVRARDVFELVALAEDFPTFLTLPAYDLID